MGFDPQKQLILRLLTKLKEADQDYPQDLWAARRQRFLRQMGKIVLGIGVEQAVKPTTST